MNQQPVRKKLVADDEQNQLGDVELDNLSSLGLETIGYKLQEPDGKGFKDIKAFKLKDRKDKEVDTLPARVESLLNKDHKTKDKKDATRLALTVKIKNPRTSKAIDATLDVDAEAGKVLGEVGVRFLGLDAQSKPIWRFSQKSASPKLAAPSKSDAAFIPVVPQPFMKFKLASSGETNPPPIHFFRFRSHIGLNATGAAMHDVRIVDASAPLSPIPLDALFPGPPDDPLADIAVMPNDKRVRSIECWIAGPFESIPRGPMVIQLPGGTAIKEVLATYLNFDTFADSHLVEFAITDENSLPTPLQHVFFT